MNLLILLLYWFYCCWYVFRIDWAPHSALLNVKYLGIEDHIYPHTVSDLWEYTRGE
jgi:hypothetical protein